MKTGDIEALRSWAGELLSAAGRPDCSERFEMTAHSAAELGRLIRELIEDRGKILSVACEERRARIDWERRCRESLCSEANLEADLKRAICDRDHNRECVRRLEQERDSLRGEKQAWYVRLGETAHERDTLAEQLAGMTRERDSLREQIQGPLVQFALELDRMNKASAQQLAGGVA